MTAAQLEGLLAGAWTDRAICRDEDPELFFPIAFSDAFAEQIEEARGVCRTCPVRTECLDYALTKPQHGIWGGTTDDERRRIRAGHDPMPESEPVTGGPVTVHPIRSEPAAKPAGDTPAEQEGEPVGILSLEALLRRASESDLAATRQAAEKIATGLKDLRQRVAKEAAEKQIRDRIATLEKELAAEQARLRELRPAKNSTRQGSNLPDGVEPKDVRAWAKERGVKCPAHGRIPQTVVDQYMAAIQ